MDISIIILNYKTPDLTINCLRSIYKAQTSFRFEVIVLDNNSQDNSKQKITKLFPQVKFLAEKTNHGFAQGNNLAAKKAAGKYLLFLNSDTLLFADTLEKTYKFLKTQPKLGALGIKLLNKDRSVQRSVFRFPSLKLFLADLLFLPFLGLFNDYRYFSYKKTRTVDFVSGAFILIPANIFHQIRGFDRSFFMYAEETDLCYRIKKLGYKVTFYPEAQLIHLGGGSTSDSKEKYQLLLNGKTHFIQKHCSKKLCFTILCLNNLTRTIFTILLPNKNKKYLNLTAYYFNKLIKK